MQGLVWREGDSPVCDFLGFPFVSKAVATPRSTLKLKHLATLCELAIV